MVNIRFTVQKSNPAPLAARRRQAVPAGYHGLRMRRFLVAAMEQ